MALASRDAIGGDLPPFFNPVNYAADLALIMEPQSVRLGKSKFKDNATGEQRTTQNVNTRVTVFRTQSDLDKGVPSEEKVYTVNATVLARDLVELLEKAKASGDPSPALIAVVKKVPTRGGNDTWVFRLPTDADYDKAAAYYEQREAKMKAALAEVPEF